MIDERTVLIMLHEQSSGFCPFVSIIIPVFNGSNYLAEAIESALNQTYKNKEIIVINDGSSDGNKTREVAMSYSSRIKYFEKENGGVASAFNYGINKMKGEYFSWLSHDDRYMPNKLQDQITYLELQNNKDVILYSQYYLIDESSKIIGQSNVFAFDHSSSLPIILQRPLINGNSVLIPRKAFDVVGLFNESLKYTQDYDMWFRLYDKYKFILLNEPLVMSRIHAQQGSKNAKNYIHESLELKISQLRQVSDNELIRFTDSFCINSANFKMLLFMYMNGGEINEYPFRYFQERLLSENWQTSEKLYFWQIIHLLFRKTINLPNRMRRIIIKTIFIFSNSQLKRLVYNAN